MANTLKEFRCQSEYCCDRDNCNNQSIKVSSLREAGIRLLKRKKEINTADWIEFFNIEEEFANECLNYVNSVVEE